jgi:hypothetical protein
MSPEEVIGNFMSFELMIKGSKKIIELDGPSTSEAQPVAFKATKEKKESTPSELLLLNQTGTKLPRKGHHTIGASCLGYN